MDFFPAKEKAVNVGLYNLIMIYQTFLILLKKIKKIFTLTQNIKKKTTTNIT